MMPAAVAAATASELPPAETATEEEEEEELLMQSAALPPSRVLYIVYMGWSLQYFVANVAGHARLLHRLVALSRLGSRWLKPCAFLRLSCAHSNIRIICYVASLALVVLMQMLLCRRSSSCRVCVYPLAACDIHHM